MQQNTAISQIVKKLMPELHEKTHFKSATTLGFKLPSKICLGHCLFFVGSLYTNADAANQFLNVKQKEDLHEEEG